MADVLRPKGQAMPDLVHSILFFLGLPLVMCGAALVLRWLFALV